DGVPVDQREHRRQGPDQLHAGSMAVVSAARARVATMSGSELLAAALGRVRERMPDVVAGLSDDDLAWRPDPEANSIAWTVWHLTRIADDHRAALAATEQVWVAEGWAERFGLPFDVREHGYSMGVSDV